MVFRGITLADREWMEQIRRQSGAPFTAYHFISLFTWQRDYGLTVAGDDDFFVVHSDYYDGFYAPLGDAAKCAAFVEATPGRYLFYTEEAAEATSLPVKELPALHEYICDTRALAVRGGKISKHYRERQRKFQREHPYRAAAVGTGDIPELNEIVDRWERENGAENKEDLYAVRAMIDNMEQLGCEGVLLRTESGERAFLLGYESFPDTFTMAAYWRDNDMSRSATLICVHELAKLLCDRYAHCNLEEDLGLEGLQRIKRSCSPLYLQKVFMVTH